MVQQSKVVVFDKLVSAKVDSFEDMEIQKLLSISSQSLNVREGFNMY